MSSKFVLAVTALTIALFIAACGVTDSPSTVSIATTVPSVSAQATPSANPVDTASAQASANGAALPQSLANAPEGAVYTFQVDPSQTTVEYAVDEVLFGNSVITRGSTSDVGGQFTLTVKDGVPTFSMSNLTVNLQSLKSDNSMRDQLIQRQWLESAKYPTATFVATGVENLSGDAVAGQAYTFKVTGDMTIRDLTKPVTFDVTVSIDGDTLTGTGTTQIYMRDFGFEPPEILGRFTVSDPATITLQGVANLVGG